MPEKTQSITFPGYDAGKLLAMAYGSLQQLYWSIRYSANNTLVAFTPQKWNRYADEITILTSDYQLTITSKMIHGELIDLMGRNKRHVEDFLAMFERTKSNATDQDIAGWNEKITALKDDTIKAAANEVKQAEEVYKVMNLSKSDLYFTYSVIAINVLVYLIMVVRGVNFFEPTGVDIIRWGGNFGPFTLSGDWWRLISCEFVHIGIIHLLFNMYALYTIGIYLEPMLGKTKYIVAYLCTGVFASLASLWWHKEPIASAGASGAIFGMYGVFLALLSTNLIPKQIRGGLLQSIGIFVVYNLVYGIKSGVDNAAHIGGLLSGIVVGYLYYIGLKQKENEKKKRAVIALIIAATVIAGVFYLNSNKVTDDVRKAAKDDIGRYEYKDEDKFSQKYNEIITLQEKALAPLRDDAITEAELAEKLNTVSLPEWQKAGQLISEMKQYNVSDRSKHKIELMDRYIQLRKKDIEIRLRWIKNKDAVTEAELAELNNKISQTIEELDKP